MIGKTISHYKILEHIGGGGMGVVYKAEDTKLKRLVALKFLPPAFATDPTTKERFIHEAQSASALQHNNICAIHEIDETDDGQMYIVMDYYEGETLHTKIKDEGLKIKEAIEYTIQIAQGLQKAHEKGIIHRDIKPANIIITNDGEAKILDFGLAKFRGQTKITKTGSTLGTVAYMSPEQAKGEEVDHRTDIWSLGVMVYEMVTGELPFKGEYDQALVYSILNEAPESIENFPPELKDIIESALVKHPDERYQSIEELIDDLRIVKGDSITTQKISRKRFRSKGKRLKYLIYPLMLIVVLFAGYFTVQSLMGKEIKPVPIAVISFENLTGDPTYDYLHKAIPNLLITDLEQSNFFHVNTWERMKDLLEQAGKKDLAYIDIDVGIELCKMDDIHAIVTGSITKIGNMFSIDVKVLDVDTKEILKSAKSVGEGENSILKRQIDELSGQIAAAVDLPEKEFAETKKRLIDVTTNELEAYKYYIFGRENWDANYHKEAIDNFNKALLIDSTLAMAHMLVANAYYWDGSISDMHKHLDLSKKYRHKVTHKEQVLIDYMYVSMKREDQSKSIAEMEKAATLYPKEKLIFDLLGDYYRYRDNDTAIFYLQKLLDLDPNNKSALNQMGYRYLAKKDCTKAVEYLQRYIDVAPNEANPFDSMGEVYLKMNDYTKSIEMYEKALKIKPDFGSAHFGVAANLIKLRKNNQARNYLNQWAKTASSYPDRSRIHYSMATAYMAEGDLENTLKEMDNGSNLALQNSDTIRFAQTQIGISAILYENGKLNEAEEKLVAVKIFLESLNLSEWNNISLWANYFDNSTRLAIQKGNIDQAKNYIELFKQNAEMEKTGIRNIKQGYFSLSGLIAYTEGNYDKAIADLKQSDLDNPFNNYHLALAYQKIGDKINCVWKLKLAINYGGFANVSKEMYRIRAEKHLESLKVLH